MNILYHLTIRPPKRPACEALSQEIAALQEHFGGETVYLNPNPHAPIYIPRLLFGFHKLHSLRAREATFDLHHLYNPDPFPFWLMHLLNRPIVYTISSGLGQRRPALAYFERLDAVTVYDERSAAQLRGWGIDNVHRVRPGIDTTRFTHTPQPLEREIHLLIGSAPWTRAQFQTKGVDALLRAAQREPRLKLTFLWRGVLFEEMRQRVQQMGVERQVQVINRTVDVNAVLAAMHGTIALATTSTLVKAYPHSLIESLVAGKPVLVSRAIPMADYVEEKGCGVVVERVIAGNILDAVDTMLDTYDDLQKATRYIDDHEFSLQTMIASFREVYKHAT